MGGRRYAAAPRATYDRRSTMRRVLVVAAIVLGLVTAAPVALASTGPCNDPDTIHLYLIPGVVICVVPPAP